MRKSLIVAAAVALVCASTALAGGWATVRLSTSPKGLSADEPWVDQRRGASARLG